MDIIHRVIVSHGAGSLVAAWSKHREYFEIIANHTPTTSAPLMFIVMIAGDHSTSNNFLL